MIAKNCAHDEITLDEILGDRLVLGVQDEKVREHLLRLNNLTLSKANDMCKATEQTSQQLKVITSRTEEAVGAVKTENKNDQGLNSGKGQMWCTHLVLISGFITNVMIYPFMTTNISN